MYYYETKTTKVAYVYRLQTEQQINRNWTAWSRRKQCVPLTACKQYVVLSCRLNAGSNYKEVTDSGNHAVPISRRGPWESAVAERLTDTCMDPQPCSSFWCLFWRVCHVNKSIGIRYTMATDRASSGRWQLRAAIVCRFRNSGVNWLAHLATG